MNYYCFTIFTQIPIIIVIFVSVDNKFLCNVIIVLEFYADLSMDVIIWNHLIIEFISFYISMLVLHHSYVRGSLFDHVLGLMHSTDIT